MGRTKKSEGLTTSEIDTIFDSLRAMGTFSGGKDTKFVELANDLGSNISLFNSIAISKELEASIVHTDNISSAEIRMLVKLFYQIQDIRKAIREQIRSIESGKSGTTEGSGNIQIKILEHPLTNIAITEKNLEKCLGAIAKSRADGRWLMEIKGVGPITAAGLLAYLDIEGKEYATQFLSYAGLNDNNRPWLGKEKSKAIVEEVVGNAKSITDDMVIEIAAKTQWTYVYLKSRAYNEEKDKWSKTDLINACAKIPYNKDLKVLLWKISDVFIKNMNRGSRYGELFAERKAYEMANNEKGMYADQAANILATKNIGKSTEAYKWYSKGMLPPAHINARARRWAEKIFLSHVFEEMYRVHYDKVPPRYYTLVHSEGKHNKEYAPEVPYTKVSEELN
jgi:hypothetical protein